jgi:hypothetical protein
MEGLYEVFGINSSNYPDSDILMVAKLCVLCLILYIGYDSFKFMLLKAVQSLTK